jgi:hypothetical protein
MAAVIIVIALACLAKPPMTRYLKTLEQKNAILGVRKLMQTARSRAMANPSVHCGVYFDVNARPPRALLFEDTFAPGSYAYDAGKDKPYLAPYTLPVGSTLSVAATYPAALIYRGDGSAYLSAKVVVRTRGLSDTLDVLASTGRIRSTR